MLWQYREGKDIWEIRLIFLLSLSQFIAFRIYNLCYCIIWADYTVTSLQVSSKSGVGGIWQWLTTKCCYTPGNIDTENWKRQKTLGLPALPGVGHTISWCITGFVWWSCGIQSFSKLLLNIQCFQAYISGKIRPTNSLLPDILTSFLAQTYSIFNLTYMGLQWQSG
jgi:hypothetical protein